MVSFWIELLERSAPLLMKGLWTTVEVFLCASALSFVLGLLFGILSCEELKSPVSAFIQTITFVLRAIPFFVQLLIVYFVFPDWIGVNLGVFPASVLALGLCSSGYVCQIIRSALNSIPTSQWEAAFSLGYSRVQTLAHIIFPQMLRNALPSLNNELEAVLKSTAILSSIGMLELTRVGMNIVSRELKQPLAIYLVVAACYVALSTILNVLAKRLERRMLRKMRPCS
jgi:His/Glu/Gln/Arg/opine family amino acid ABC transporter permease subunit